jgi:hypothetical protein
MRKSFHEQLAETEGLVVDTAGIVFQQRARTLGLRVMPATASARRPACGDELARTPGALGGTVYRALQG